MGPNINGNSQKRHYLTLLWPALGERSSTDYQQPLLLTHLFPMHLFSTPYSFLMSLGGREKVHWERMGQETLTLIKDI